MENKREIVLASKSGASDWLKIRPPANWTVRYVRLSTLMERHPPAAITVIKSDPGANMPRIQKLAKSLGRQGITKAGNEFLIWVIEDAPRQFYRDLFQSFAEPSHVEIVRHEYEVENWLKPFIAKFEVISERYPETKESDIETTPATPPRPSPLDSVNAIVAATKDLRTQAGRLSAERVAETFGVPPSRLATWLGRSRQALLQAPDSESLQMQLGYFERIARLRALLEQPADFRKWLRMPSDQLEGRQPLDLIAEGKWQVIADLVDDILVGSPS